MAYTDYLNLGALFPAYFGSGGAGTAATSSPMAPAPVNNPTVFGQVPGITELPNPAGDLAAVYPNLTQTNQQVSSGILSKLRGEISPATQAAIQDAAARFGVRSGMPGSGLAGYKSLRDLGLTSEQVQQQGLADYNATIPTVSRTQTVAPETQIGLSQSNAALRAAPDPTLAGTYSQTLFNNYLASMRQRPSGGTGMFTGQTSPVVETPTQTYLRPAATFPHGATALAPGPGTRESNMAAGTSRSAYENGMSDLYDWAYNEGGYGLPTSVETVPSTAQFTSGLQRQNTADFYGIPEDQVTLADVQNYGGFFNPTGDWSGPGTFNDWYYPEY